jgi:hypothetical protein
MTDAHVGSTGGTVITLRLDDATAEALRRWAEIGRRSVEETVLAAIDEYLQPIETEAHGGAA